MAKKKKAPREKKPSPPQHRWLLSSLSWPWGAILLIFILTALVRVHFLDVPLERDEGEYAYAGQLILQGIPPYTLVYNMKMPGIYIAYSTILAVLGQTSTGIHLALLIVNLASVLLVFLTVRRVFDDITGVVAGACYALLSMSYSVQGISANAEHFVLLFALAGILCLQNALESKKRWQFLGSGFLLGLAFMMKQHGLSFILFAFLYAFVVTTSRRASEWRQGIRNVLLLAVGAVTPFGITCLLFALLGIFGKFWFWTFVYAQTYVSSLPLSEGVKNFGDRISFIMQLFPFIFVLAGIGTIALFWKRRPPGQRLFALLFCVFSFLSMVPGFYFREHYFILILPALGLLAGMGVSFVGRLLSSLNALLGAVILVAMVASVLFDSGYRHRDYLFEPDPFIVSRMAYGLNPFPESLAIAKYIKDRTSEEDRIAVLGSEPQIYFYAQRRSATGYIYTYPLMEGHEHAEKMQKEMTAEIESTKPKYLVFVNVPMSWGAWKGSHPLIIRWLENYERQHYERVGVVDMISPMETRYKWDDDALGYRARSKNRIYVFRRKTK